MAYSNSAGSWARASGPRTSSVNALADGGGAGAIDIGVFGGGYFSTDDGGATVTVGGQTALRGVRALYRNGNTLLVGTDGLRGNGLDVAGLFRSTDDGANFSSASGLPDGAGITSLASDGTAIFAAVNDAASFTDRGVYRSTDNGDSWQATTGFAISRFGIEILSMAEDSAGVIYLGDEHAGLSVSSDGAASWTPDSDGLAPSGVCIGRIEALLINDGQVYAGNGAGDGLFVSNVLGSDTAGDSVDCTTDTDIFPDAFSFTTQNGVATGAVITSNTVAITGIAAPVDVSVAGGEYSIGCDGSFTNQAGSIDHNQTVCVRHTAAGTGETATTTTLTVGDQSGSFISVTGLAFNGDEDEVNTGFGDGGFFFTDPGPARESANSNLILPDGSIVLVGVSEDSLLGSANRSFVVVKLLADGSPDNSFGANGISSTPVSAGFGSLSKVLRQPDGKLLLAGSAQNNNDTPSDSNDDFTTLAVVRLNPDGSLDTSDGDNGIFTYDVNPNEINRGEQVGGAAFDSSGALILGGGIVTNGAGTQFFAVRITGNGSIDTDFGSDPGVFADGVAHVPTGGTSTITPGGLAIDSQGRIILAGLYKPGFSTIAGGIARMTSAGQPDTTFDTDGFLSVGNVQQFNDLTLTGDNILLASGSNGDQQPRIVKILANATLDGNFGNNGVVEFNEVKGQMLSVLVLSDGRIAASGIARPSAASFSDPSQALYVIVNADGSRIPGFGTNGYLLRSAIGADGLTSAAIAERADGSVLHSGAYTNGNGSDGGFAAFVFGGDGGGSNGNDDTMPDAFSFTDLMNVEPNTQQTSNAITVSGIDAPAQVTVTGGQYSIGCATGFTDQAGSIDNGDTVCVRHTSDAQFDGTVDTTLAIGGVTDTL